MAARFSDPKAEKQYSWLKCILDTFYISDSQLEEHLKKVKKSGAEPACHKGCHACCLNPDVPLTEPELLAISWYASEVLDGGLRPRVKQRLYEHREQAECPFLVDRSCSIYPVRPLICRQFLVMNRPCEVGEDIGISRTNDILPLPQNEVIRPVAMRLLDHFKFQSTPAKRKAFESGFIVENARSMHEYPWENIAQTMEHFDDKR